MRKIEVHGRQASISKTFRRAISKDPSCRFAKFQIVRAKIGGADLTSGGPRRGAQKFLSRNWPRVEGHRPRVKDHILVHIPWCNLKYITVDNLLHIVVYRRIYYDIIYCMLLHIIVYYYDIIDCILLYIIVYVMIYFIVYYCILLYMLWYNLLYIIVHHCMYDDVIYCILLYIIVCIVV